jgi:hypothetical protein
MGSCHTALHGAQFERLGFCELGDPFKDSPNHVPLYRIGPLVDVLPSDRLVRPDQPAEPLDQPISAGTIRVSATDVFGNLRGLSVAQYSNADRLNMNVTAGDAVEGVRLGTRPSAKIETSRNALLFAIEVLEQRDEFVTLDQEPGRIRYQQRADRLVARIIGAIPNGLRLFRPGAEP